MAGTKPGHDELKLSVLLGPAYRCLADFRVFEVPDRFAAGFFETSPSVRCPFSFLPLCETFAARFSARALMRFFSSRASARNFLRFFSQASHLQPIGFRYSLKRS